MGLMLYKDDAEPSNISKSGCVDSRPSVHGVTASPVGCPLRAAFPNG